MRNFTPITRKSGREAGGQYKFNDLRNTVASQVETFLNENRDNLCRIDFVIDASKTMSGHSLLSFSYSTGKTVSAGNVPDYEIYFTKDFLDAGTFALSEQLGLFRSQLPIIFIVNQEFKWRINEIFESINTAATKADLYQNELIRIHIRELILFTRRLILININQLNLPVCSN
ncbi:hypothetical protein FHW88_005609 [Mucilaginibacter sp. SG538B]|uniref:hypothetical protein n=1 Tax=Mucilaginibacter sp. SG538B TaxID=2587021 RepID=UPI00159E91D8|nr:hypothetical protein [Mucilaginibacter sp. SG538B]NVM67288.1 hypothetical protein [Mucilaginibacter sp. SG538B]